MQLARRNVGDGVQTHGSLAARDRAKPWPGAGQALRAVEEDARQDDRLVVGLGRRGVGDRAPADEARVEPVLDRQLIARCVHDAPQWARALRRRWRSSAFSTTCVISFMYCSTPDALA